MHSFSLSLITSSLLTNVSLKLLPVFKPVLVHWSGRTFEIQLNACTDPFCKWFGKPQERFESVRYKPYRYKLTGNPKEHKQRVTCNSDPVCPGVGITWNCTSNTFSNWSAAEENTRLITNGSVQDRDEDYLFHRRIVANLIYLLSMTQKHFIDEARAAVILRSGSAKSVGRLQMFCLNEESPFPMTKIKMISFILLPWL
jgi:hypothetical protein